MKPSIAVSGGPSGVSEISGGLSGERTEQITCKPVRENSVLHSTVGCRHSKMHFVIGKTIQHFKQRVSNTVVYSIVDTAT
jgi:hypothetical protein